MAGYLGKGEEGRRGEVRFLEFCLLLEDLDRDRSVKEIFVCTRNLESAVTYMIHIYIQISLYYSTLVQTIKRTINLYQKISSF